MTNQSEQEWNDGENKDGENLLFSPSDLLPLAQYTRNLSLRAKLAVAIQAKRVNIVHIQPALFDAWLAEHEK
ncbi:hypothetical protein [Herpetosiphon giganteus]|uniref:hypothetical protein n=1 Tax=Herpetosiphon giganteus TaxID=2029754 RepID=UPI00195C7FD5|nr:hypothetical protein [Herpetosiphon giganteus]MBM7846278.1 hypothetical protein [Herpetosiphon giganteus]